MKKKTTKKKKMMKQSPCVFFPLFICFVGRIARPTSSHVRATLTHARASTPTRAPQQGSCSSLSPSPLASPSDEATERTREQETRAEVHS